VRYELGFYIPEDGILRSHRHGNIKSYRSNFSGYYITETAQWRATFGSFEEDEQRG
jgi:hypothetical protein